MRRIAMCTAAAAVLAMGCGDDAEEGGGRAERDFRTKATRLCQDANVRLVQSKLPDDVAGMATLDRQVEASERQLFAALKRLEAPERLRETFTRAVATGDRADAADGFEAVGLDDCFAYGVTGIRAGWLFAEAIEPKCTAALGELRQGIAAAHDPAQRGRVMGRELKELGLALEIEGAPAQAATLFETVVAETKDLGELLEAAARGTRPDVERAELLGARTYAAWELLNVGGCEDLYEVMQGKPRQDDEVAS